MNKLLIATAATFFAFASFVGTGAEAAGFSVPLTAPKAASNVLKTGCHGGGRRAFSHFAIQSARRAAQRRQNYIAQKEAIARKQAIAQKKLALAKAKAKAQAQAQAKAEAAAEAAKLAEQQVEKPVETASVETQNSSITTAKGDVAATETKKPEQKVAVAKELGCKKFFPSVGMTLTVPCE